MKPGQAVNIESWAGPCFSGVIVRINPKSVTVDTQGYPRRVPKGIIHTEKCPNCDNPYMN